MIKHSTLSFYLCFARVLLAVGVNNARSWNLFQGDYIRHPVLYELSNKYGVAGSDQGPLPARLDVLREHIRREIRKVCRVSLTPSSTAASAKLSFSVYTR